MTPKKEPEHNPDTAVEKTESRPANGSNNEKLVASLDITALQRMKISELYAIAKELKIEEMTTLEKHDLIYKIMQLKTNEEGTVACEGILERLPDGYGFLRVNNYLPSSEDIYVSSAQIRKFSLLTGDSVTGLGRKPKEGERYFSLVRVDTINGLSPEVARKRTFFSNLVPIFPDQKLHLEFDPKNITTRLIDMIAPIGFGQRAMVVSPPKAGKTVMLKDIARSIETNHPEVIIKVLLIDERPEEVTDMQRFVKGEVVASTFDEPPEQHVKVSELLLESAKRLVEHGKDVVILLDSITRLARAHNLVVAPSGRTLSGGLDPASLHKPKRFFGAARNIEGGGSLTIIATALVDTGSRMDDVIYEEFKGTGNMELHLDRKLANRRIYPAIDVVASGTRKEELLLPEDVLKKTVLLRKSIDSENATEELVNLLKKTKNNSEFFNSGIFG
jgi:transcription termination factor Rho